MRVLMYARDDYVFYTVCLKCAKRLIKYLSS